MTMIALLAALTAVAPQATPAAPAEGDKDVIVTGERVRGSVIGTVPPLATLDEAAIRALGVSTMKDVLERLKGVGTSMGGDEPVLLLNGRRISGWQEMQSIPPEAIERTEILPEEEAPRFGFPPTVRIMNFITKQHFRATSALQLAGSTTEGGGGSNYTEANSTQIEGDRRTSLMVPYFRQARVVQSARDIVPDPVTRFAVPGNVAARGGATLDPRLDALAGQPVTIAAVPGDAALRGELAAYAVGANRPAVSDPGAQRWLVPQRDTVQASGTIAMPLGTRVSGSLDLSLEAQRTTGRNGWAGVELSVPAGALPFDAPVTLYRYLPEAVLRRRSTDLKLHAGATLSGTIAKWGWNATASHDRVRSAARAEQGIDPTPLQRAIDAGGDPFAPLGTAFADARLVDRSTTRTGTTAAKLVANGPLLQLPAGPVQMTLNADYARSASQGMQLGLAGRMLDLTRATRGLGVNATLPIAAAAQGVLPMLGRLSLQGSASVVDVSRVGRLATIGYGGSWSPVRPLQLSVTRSDTRTAPDIATLTAATLVTPNVPLFDFATGRDAVVTLVSGGNAALVPPRQRSTQWSAAVRPFAKSELNLTLSYLTAVERGGRATPGTTALLQAAFPDRFVRDAGGRLVQVDIRPVNIAAEVQRKLQLGTNLMTSIGAKKTPGKPGTSSGGVSLFSSLTGSWRLEDRVTLRAGVPTIDLLGGGTLDGRGGRPRWELNGFVAATAGAVSASTYLQFQGPTRVRDPLPASDLRFSGRTWMVVDLRGDAERLVHRPWTRQMSVSVTVENPLNDRVNVRDATGAVPNRFQPAYLDPIGRSIRFGVRKLF